MSAAKHTPLSVVAVVSASDGRELLVLNRPLHFVYERRGNDYIGSDGPFRDCLAYERGSGRFVAFAGRSLSLTLTDGSAITIKDHWWSVYLAGYTSVATGDVESLKKCYVFCGGHCIHPDELTKLRATYSGCVYTYWDYEKVIKFDDLRRDLWRRVHHEERRRKALTQAVKAKHRELLAAIAKAQGSAS